MCSLNLDDNSRIFRFRALGTGIHWRLVKENISVTLQQWEDGLRSLCWDQMFALMGLSNDVILLLVSLVSLASNIRLLLNISTLFSLSLHCLN